MPGEGKRFGGQAYISLAGISDVKNNQIIGKKDTNTTITDKK